MMSDSLAAQARAALDACGVDAGRIDAHEAQRLPDVARRFARIDRDGDGGLTLAELAAATVHPAAPTAAPATRARRLDLANPG